MIVGEGSESYRTPRDVVQRLPAMISPARLKTPTQAIAIEGGHGRPALSPAAGSRGAEWREPYLSACT
jgi:hypothetical protein